MGVFEQLANKIEILTKEVRDLRKDLIDLKQKKEEEAESSDRFITKKEAANILRCSQSTIDNYRRNGKLKSHKIGKSVLFHREDVIAIVS